MSERYGSSYKGSYYRSFTHPAVRGKACHELQVGIQSLLCFRRHIISFSFNRFRLLFSIFPSFTFFASSITSPKSCYLSKASHASSSLSPPPEPYQILLPVNNLSCIALAPSSTYEITAASTGKYVLYFSSSESSGDRQHLLRLPHRLHVHCTYLIT